MHEQVEDSAQEVRNLQRCINDLVSLLALPAIWTGREPAQIIHTLLDAVIRALSLEFAYARLGDAFNPTPIEILLVGEYARINLPSEELRHFIGASFAPEREYSPARRLNHTAIEDVIAFSQPLGVQGEIGVLVAGSDRAGFPSKTERLLLGVAANQASLGLQEARLLSEQKRINADLDRRVAERTAKLAEINEELQLQVGLLQHLPVSAWTLKPDGTPDFVNRVWLEFSGQTLDFVRSHPEAWMTAIHPEDREAASRAFWHGVSSGQGFAFETRSLRAKDRTYRWHLQQAVVFSRNSKHDLPRPSESDTDLTFQAQLLPRMKTKELRW
jgi:PAS domain-containing protein